MLYKKGYGVLTRIKSVSVPEGDGVTVNRLFPIREKLMNHDPFVLFDHFEVADGQGFPTHPHRGFEAITYLFSGAMRHKDNLGNDSLVTEGGAQIFCAGKGFSHSEMPEGGELTCGIQLWINLGQKDKSLEPSYQSVDVKKLPVVEFDNGSRKVIVGKGSPVHLHTEVCYEHISLFEGSEHQPKVDRGFQGFVYLLNGELEIEKSKVNPTQAMLFSGETLPPFVIKATRDSEYILVIGKPHHEPIKQFGPFVD